MDRRQYLQTLTVGGILGTAGCTTPLIDGGSGESPMTTHEGWPMPGYDAGNTAARATGPPLDDGVAVTWREEFPPSMTTYPPVVHEGTVVVPRIVPDDSPGEYQSQYRIHAFTEDNGDERWTRTVDRAIESGVTAIDGRVYVGGSSGTPRLEAFDIADGSELWSTSVATTPVAAPVVLEDTAYVPAGNQLVAVSTATGDVQWQTDLDATVVPAQPAVRDGTVVVGCRDGRVRGVDAAGDGIRWRQEVTTGWVRVGPIAGNGIVVTGDSNRLVGIVDGERQWTFAPDRAFSRPAVGTDRVYVAVGSNAPTLQAITADSGDRAWQASMPPGPGPLTLVGDLLLVGGPNQLHALDATDGTVRWQQTLSLGGLPGPVVVSSSGLYHQSTQGDLAALEPTN